MSAPTTDTPTSTDTSRRSFLRNGLTVAGGMTAFVAALSPLRDMDPDDKPSLSKFLQKHYKEMDEADMEEALARITAEVKKRYDIDPVVRDVRSKAGGEFVYALNLSRCIGCRKFNGQRGNGKRFKTY